MADYQNLRGKKFGRWTVIECEKVIYRRRMWLCICDCGKKKSVYASSLLSGKSKSCGCLHSEILKEKHTKRNNIKKTRLFRVYLLIKNRCYNPKAHNYPRYGGIGIKMCQEWFDDFKSFYDWAMSCPEYNDFLTIHRKDNSKGYEPENCRWVTSRTNSSNGQLNPMRVRVVKYLYFNYICSIPEIAKMYHVNNGTINNVVRGRTWTNN